MVMGVIVVMVLIVLMTDTHQVNASSKYQNWTKYCAGPFKYEFLLLKRSFMLLIRVGIRVAKGVLLHYI